MNMNAVSRYVSNEISNFVQRTFRVFVTICCDNRPNIFVSRGRCAHYSVQLVVKWTFFWNSIGESRRGDTILFAVQDLALRGMWHDRRGRTRYSKCGEIERGEKNQGPGKNVRFPFTYTPRLANDATATMYRRTNNGIIHVSSRGSCI